MANDNRRVVLPAALPGILTGFILSLSKSAGRNSTTCAYRYTELYYWQHLEVYWINFQHYLSNIYLGENATRRIPECCIGRHYRFTSYLNLNEWRCDYFYVTNLVKILI